ncbi:MAG: ABC transporter substrate-binding protein [Brevinema sp.]
MKKIAFFSIFFFLVAACSSAPKKNSLSVAMPTEPPSLTAYSQNDTQSYRVRLQVFERLIAMDTNGQLVSALAETWTNISPTVFQVELRPGVLFHNGEMMTAEDVKYSVERASTSPTLRSVLGVIKGAEVVDENRVNILLNMPYASIAILLTHPGLVITHKATQEVDENNDAYVGTGPYKFVEWRRGDSITLTRNEDYWAGLAPIEQVVFRIVPDDSVRAIAVETGEVDVAYDIAGGDRERFVETSKVRFIEAPMARQDYLGFNIGRPVNTVWTNMLIRQAIANVIDYQGIINSVLFGGATPASSIISPIVFGATTNLPPRARNLDKAKGLMVEAGSPTGVKGRIFTMDGPRKKIAEVIQANARDIGIDLEVVVVEWATQLDYAAKGQLDLYLAGWTSVPSDADVGMYALAHSSSAGAGGNYAFYSNPQIDRLLTQGRGEQNPATRIGIYAQAQEIIYNEAPIIPLFYTFNNAAIAKDLEGFVLNQFSMHEIKFISRK